MKVLVTGAAGFIGANVALHYRENGHEVLALDNLFRTVLYSDVPSEQNLPLLEEAGVEFYRADIRDFYDVRRAVEQCDLVVHAAGQTSVPTSIEQTVEDFWINAGGALNVLQACREVGEERGERVRVVLMSTNKVYGSRVNDYVVGETETRYLLSDEFREGVPESFGVDGGNHVPYGASMVSRDIYGQTFNARGWVDVAVFRGSCIYGPHQFGVKQQGWISWFSRATVNEVPITIYGDGKQVRDVTYIGDLLRAMDLFLLDGGEPGVYNIGGGPENSLSVLEGLELISELTGKQQELSYGEWRENDQRVYISGIERAEKVLGWSPEVGYREGVETVVEEYLDAED